MGVWERKEGLQNIMFRTGRVLESPCDTKKAFLFFSLPAIQATTPFAQMEEGGGLEKNLSCYWPFLPPSRAGRIGRRGTEQHRGEVYWRFLELDFPKPITRVYLTILRCFQEFRWFKFEELRYLTRFLSIFCFPDNWVLQHSAITRSLVLFRIGNP